MACKTALGHSCRYGRPILKTPNIQVERATKFFQFYIHIVMRQPIIGVCFLHISSWFLYDVNDPSCWLVGSSRVFAQKFTLMLWTNSKIMTLCKNVDNGVWLFCSYFPSRLKILPYLFIITWVVHTGCLNKHGYILFYFLGAIIISLQHLWTSKRLWSWVLFFSSLYLGWPVLEPKAQNTPDSAWTTLSVNNPNITHAHMGISTYFFRLHLTTRWECSRTKISQSPSLKKKKMSISS